ncbi:MAG: superoxide dismutase [Candidatus Melainabacteria bacterium]|nr:MAG: superoxide dismutase [Candidatus Melainabacteria bacterium]
MGAVAAAGALVAPAFAAAGGATAPAASGPEPYVAKDFSGLQGKLDGLSASQIEQHLKLYKGYIGKANELRSKLKEVELASANATYSPIREMLVEQSFAVNGVIYHEFYFGNLGGKGGEPTGDLKSAMEERWGTMAKFNDFLKAAGKSVRGWVVIGYNTRGGFIDSFGLDTHNIGSPANFVPLLVLDVYEHAYMVDYGIDRAKYLDAFMKNVDWDVVGKRFNITKKHPTGLDATI